MCWDAGWMSSRIAKHSNVQCHPDCPEILTKGENLRFSLTRQLLGVAMAAVLLVALGSLLLAGPVLAEDSPAIPDLGTDLPPATAPEVPAPVEPAPAPVEPSTVPPPEVPVTEPEVLAPPANMEPLVVESPAHVVPEPVIEPPVGEVVPDPAFGETQAPALETTQPAIPEPMPAPVPTTSVPAVTGDITKTAAIDEGPQSSPFYVQLIMIAVLIIIGFAYFKLMGSSGRQAPTATSVAAETDGKQSPDV